LSPFPSSVLHLPLVKRDILCHATHSSHCRTLSFRFLSSSEAELLERPFAGKEALFEAIVDPLIEVLLLSTGEMVPVPAARRGVLLEVAGAPRVAVCPEPTVVLRDRPAPVERPTVLARAALVGVRGDDGVTGSFALPVVAVVRLAGSVFACDDTLVRDVGLVFVGAATGCWGLIPSSSRRDFRSRGFAVDMMRKTKWQAGYVTRLTVELLFETGFFFLHSRITSYNKYMAHPHSLTLFIIAFNEM
jgi:hypothetical protein